MPKFIFHSHKTIYCFREIEADSMVQAMGIFESDDDIGPTEAETFDLDSIDALNEKGEVIGGISYCPEINDN